MNVLREYAREQVGYVLACERWPDSPAAVGMYQRKRDASFDSLLARIASLELDARRLNFAAENYIAADFRYGAGKGISVIIIQLPEGTDAATVCGDLRIDLDRAMQNAPALQPTETLQVAPEVIAESTEILDAMEASGGGKIVDLMEALKASLAKSRENSRAG
jgi:hypothetical protein